MKCEHDWETIEDTVSYLDIAKERYGAKNVEAILPSSIYAFNITLIIKIDKVKYCISIPDSMFYLHTKVCLKCSAVKDTKEDALKYLESLVDEEIDILKTKKYRQERAKAILRLREKHS